MTQLATIVKEVSFRPGDGVSMPIPEGIVELEMAPDSATLSWTEDDGVSCVTAIPLIEFNEYVRNGSIRLEK